MSYFNYLCLLVHSGFQLLLTIWVTWRLSYMSRKLVTIRGWLRSPPVFMGDYLFGFLWCFFCFVCLPPVSCLSGVVGFSGLAILNSLFGFLWRLLYYIQIVFRFITYHGNVLCIHDRPLLLVLTVFDIWSYLLCMLLNTVGMLN